MPAPAPVIGMTPMRATKTSPPKKSATTAGTPSIPSTIRMPQTSCRKSTTACLKSNHLWMIPIRTTLLQLIYPRMIHPRTTPDARNPDAHFHIFRR